MIAARIRRPATAPLLIAAVVFAAVLPPAHIHLAEHDDHDHDHAAAVEHSHWSAHQSSRAAFDDDDGRVIFVRFIITRPSDKEAHFEQAYSADGGMNWETNWFAVDTRR